MINNVKYFAEVLKKINKLLNRKQKLQSINVFWWMLISSVLELLGISIMLPFLNALLSPDKLMKNKYISLLVKCLGIQSYTGLLGILVASVIIIYIIKNLLLVYSRGIQVKYQCQIEKDLSTNMVMSYMNRPYSYFVKTNSSDIRQGAINDVFSVFCILQALFQLMAEGITCIFIIAYIVYTDWIMALGLILAGSLITVILIFGFKNILKHAGEQYRTWDVERNKSITEISQGIKDILVMQRKDFFINGYEKACNEYKKAKVINSIAVTCPERIIEAMFVASILLIVFLRIMQGVEVNEFIAQLGAFVVAAYRLLPSINKFSVNFNQIIFYNISLNVAYDNIQAAREYMKNDMEGDSSADISFKQGIDIQNVTWKYEAEEKKVLENVSLHINKGDSVAIIGESGAGKTTLADILLGLYKPTHGKVLVDGQDIYSNLKQWAEIISYVPQTVYLLDDTVKNNVVFGHSDVDETKVWEALEQAQLKAFVEGLPNGLDTMVGEAGVRFSGGQRQRIAIARALYNNPSVLVLDEATAALDNDTESAVMEAIDSLKGKKTLVIIAHRLTTIKNCNKVYEIKNKKIIDVTSEYAIINDF